MIRVGSCTVLYNPTEEVLTNISTYSECVDICVIVDNSDKKTKTSFSFMENSKYIYIDMEGNKGIAAALNRGIEYLNSQAIDFALTMDQDSKFPTKYYKKIIDFVEANTPDYSVVGLNFNHECNDIENRCVDVPYWITSGNFVNVRDFMRIGEFDEALFIDYVDFEYGYKLFRNGLKIGYLENYSLQHQIGNPIPIHIFGRTYYAMNHSPVRYYYRYRNSLFLYMKDQRFFGKLFLKEIFINLPKMLIFEKNRKMKLLMIKKGLIDVTTQKMGKFAES